MPVLERDITSYIDGWQNTPSEQFVEELASLTLETNRIADPFIYKITESNELFSPTKHTRIKDEVKDKTSQLGQMECQAILAVEEWAVQKNEGAIIWISPPYPGHYSVSKIVVHEIQQEGGKKRLFNRAIVLDYDEKQCMMLAWNLTGFSINKPLFNHLDRVRATPLFLETKGKSWINILEKFIDDPKLWETIRNGEDRILKEEALKRARVVQKQFFETPGRFFSSEAKMAVKQMLGPHQESCPPKSGLQSGTALEAVSESALTYYGSSLSKDPDFCKNCPVCGKQINCVVRKGGSCPECRAVKKCA